MRAGENKVSVLLALLLILAAVAGGFLLGFYSAPREQTVFSPSVETIFSPGSEPRLVAFVDSAQRSIDVELYQFSNSALKAALVRAAARGVAARVILEPKVDTNFETAEFLSGKGVAVRWAWQGFANTHAKSAVVDAQCVLVGSINWSQRGVDDNREAAVITCRADAARDFERVFESDWNQATPYAA